MCNGTYIVTFCPFLCFIYFTFNHINPFLLENMKPNTLLNHINRNAGKSNTIRRMRYLYRSK